MPNPRKIKRSRITELESALAQSVRELEQAAGIIREYGLPSTALVFEVAAGRKRMTLSSFEPVEASHVG